MSKGPSEHQQKRTRCLPVTGSIRPFLMSHFAQAARTVGNNGALSIWALHASVKERRILSKGLTHLSNPCELCAEGAEFWCPAWLYKAAKFIDHFQSAGFTSLLVRPFHQANWPFLNLTSFSSNQANEINHITHQDFIWPMKPS